MFKLKVARLLWVPSRELPPMLSPCTDSGLPLHHHYTKFWRALLWGHSPMFSKPFGNPAASLGVPLTWKHEKNHINPKTKILKPIFIAGQKDTCENFQFSTDQGDSCSGIFPIALLYLFDNLRMLLNWLLPDLTIPKALTLTCFGNMVGV